MIDERKELVLTKGEDVEVEMMGTRGKEREGPHRSRAAVLTELKQMIMAKL
jgi:hypothetical protein